MKILIADGEAGAAASLADRLRQLGFDDVHPFQRSDEALAFAVAEGRIDVLIAEIFLEPDNGFTLRNRLESRIGKFETIFHTDLELEPYAEHVGDSKVLAKPASEEDMLALLQPAAPQPAAIPTPKATPVAQPAATPTPKATPVAQPAATPTPKATPVAQPAATPTPKATPVAQPAATPTPKATPVAQPAATPTPKATPVAQPAATPTPKATPVAQPAATPTPKATPVAQPAATPAPKATPVAQPAATPTPKATPVAQPAATPAPKATPAAQAAPPSASSIIQVQPASETELPPDELVGRTIGGYVVEARLGATPRGGIYRATQTSVGRKVRFYALNPEAASAPEEVQRFVSDASVKANVRHPCILAVFEASQADGITFYSCEYIPGASLQQLAGEGKKLDESTALQAMKTAAEALAYFHREKIRHEMITANAILITAKKQVRIANIAAHEVPEEFDSGAEIQRLAEIIAGALEEQSDGKVPGLRELLAGILGPNNNHRTWSMLLQAINALKPKAQIADAHKLQARDRAAIMAVEQARKKQRRSVIISSAVSLVLLATALGIVWWALFGRGVSIREFDTMVRIPAGEFIYQDGERVSLPEFWIDEHEVTIAQYARFLEWLEENPDKISEIAHPDAPSGKDYIPEDWADMTELTPPHPGYYQRARRWGRYRGAALDLNSPVFGVDFFDAYAYANWKGRRLPTEQEWEKAARGTNGYLYPWGNEPDHSRVNSGQDYDPNDPEGGGEIDGWQRWSPVDAMSGDRSPFGVVGMAGNVSEWTDTWVESESERLRGMRVPVIRGGNWGSPDYEVTRRIDQLMPEQNDERVGFRTASDKPPGN